LRIKLPEAFSAGIGSVRIVGIQGKELQSVKAGNSGEIEIPWRGAGGAYIVWANIGAQEWRRVFVDK
jgi:hypothetical protein